MAALSIAVDAGRIRRRRRSSSAYRRAPRFASINIHYLQRGPASQFNPAQFRLLSETDFRFLVSSASQHILNQRYISIARYFLDEAAIRENEYKLANKNQHLITTI